MTDRYLEDFAVGQTFGSGRLRIDKERIKFSQHEEATQVLLGPGSDPATQDAA
jgi:hypothetical protein